MRGGGGREGYILQLMHISQWTSVEYHGSNDEDKAKNKKAQTADEQPAPKFTMEVQQYIWFINY